MEQKSIEERIQEMYYKDILKLCKNCGYYRKFIMCKCKRNPNFLTSDALNRCNFAYWIPNQKLFNK